MVMPLPEHAVGDFAPRRVSQVISLAIALPQIAVVVGTLILGRWPLRPALLIPIAVLWVYAASYVCLTRLSVRVGPAGVRGCTRWLGVTELAYTDVVRIRRRGAQLIVRDHRGLQIEVPLLVLDNGGDLARWLHHRCGHRPVLEEDDER